MNFNFLRRLRKFKTVNIKPANRKVNAYDLELNTPNVSHVEKICEKLINIIAQFLYLIQKSIRI